MSLRSQRPQNAPPLAPPIPPSSTSLSETTTNNSSSKPPPLTLEQSRQVAKTHYDALKSWLTREGALTSTSTTRTNARDKLTRLTRQQFQELSTDVYDELIRRIEDAAGRPGEQPFLPVRSDFHPKRNQARQKLATLPLQRFKDLASDVYFELDRRYPEFNNNNTSDPSSNNHTPSRSDSLSSTHSHHPPPPPPNLNSRERRTPTPQQGGGGPRSPIDERGPAGPNNSFNNEVVVPNKSTMVVEQPSGNFTTTNQPPASLSPTYSDQQQRGTPPPPPPPPASAEPPIRSDELSPLQNQQPNFGGGGVGPFRGQQSRISEVSSVGTHSKFFGGYAGSAAGGGNGGGTNASDAGRRSNEWETNNHNHHHQELLDKQKNDYEYRLQMLQNRISELERENQDAASALRGRNDSTTTNNEQQHGEKVRYLETRLQETEQSFKDQTSQLRMVQRDLDTLQQQQRSVGSGSNNEEERRLRNELESAEDLANELRNELSSLVDELRMVNERCEDLQTELDKERRDKESKERETVEWKEKWQRVKTELRNLKATSQLFTSSSNHERLGTGTGIDFMPASPDGLIQDSSISTFQTSIDDLLESARSKEPSSVILQARKVVSAVEKIDKDVQAIPSSRYNQFSLQDQDLINSLKAKINATLSNLMTASKNHATSFGVSPVSLLDAAASHLACTIVELVRILKIRKSSSSFEPSSSSTTTTTSSSSRFNREPPMPPLPEDSSSSSTSIHSYSSPRSNQSRELPPTNTTSSTISGGVSSLVSSSTAGMRNALEAMGIASSSRDSRSTIEGTGGGEKDRESGQRQEEINSPQSDYQQSQQFQRGNSFYSSTSRDNDDDQQQQRQRYDQYGSNRGEVEPQQYQPQNNGYDDRGYSNDIQDYGSPREANIDELRSYVENQTEAIVHSIQSLLSAIRSGSQGEQLNENLTQIITIVSSIVAISKQALTTSSSSNSSSSLQGETILNDLTDHCDKLSEMQSETSNSNSNNGNGGGGNGGGGNGNGGSFTKQTKQAMATASFGVAKSLKQLNGLFADISSSSSMTTGGNEGRYGNGEEGLV